MEKTIFTNRWYALKPSKLVRRKPSRVEFLGNNLAIWRNKDNQVVIQDDNCPHRGAQLSMGKVKNNCIECPYHGWAFDSEGSLIDVPADNNSSLLKNTNIETFHTIESGGLVWTCIGTPDGYNPPVLKEMYSNSDESHKNLTEKVKTLKQYRAVFWPKLLKADAKKEAQGMTGEHQQDNGQTVEPEAPRQGLLGRILRKFRNFSSWIFSFFWHLTTALLIV